MRSRYPNAVEVRGEGLEVSPPERFVFSYGYVDPASPFPPGATRVSIRLEEHSGGTRLHLRHELAEVRHRDDHDRGWRYQLGLFANVVAAEQHAGVARAIDGFFAWWSERDAGRRRAALEAVTTADVALHDGYACLAGRDDLVDHVTAVHRHLGAAVVRRAGKVRQCQGLALADRVAVWPDGTVTASGTNVFDLAPDGCVSRAVGLSSPAA